jgi:hypothetical protein
MIVYRKQIVDGPELLDRPGAAKQPSILNGGVFYPFDEKFLN